MGDRILVTGVNIISSLGLGIDENWKSLLEARSGIKPISLFNPEKLETRFAGQVPSEFDEFSAQYIKKRKKHQMTRVTQMYVAAVKDMIEKQNIDFSNYKPERCAVIAGVIHTANNSIEGETSEQNKIIKGMTNAVPAWVSLEYGFEGPSYSLSTACASSAYAIAAGYELIKSDKADFVIVGGTDSTINPEEIAGFNAIHALSTQNDSPHTASCPFSANRDGFVIGEGAGVLILERKSFALKRNAVIYAEMAGYALSSEAFNIMAPKTNGEGMAKTMNNAILDSKINKTEIDYINAHGTSTILNDLYESTAIEEVFGDYAQRIAVSSTKSMTGHTIGAAGAIEAAVTVMSVCNDVIHPTINFQKADPDLKLDYVPNVKREKLVRAALSNSFGFGGHNATLVFKKYKK